MSGITSDRIDYLLKHNLMVCRECKKEYKSKEWRSTANLRGICSKKCSIEHSKKCRPSPINDAFMRGVSE